RSLRPLRAAAVGARARGGAAAAAPGVVPRPRPARVDAVRRRPRTGERGAPARPLPSGARARAEAKGGGAVGGLITRALANIRAGRLQRLLCLAAAASAPPLAFEVYLEHYKGSFGDKWMWTPIVLTPPLTAAGIAGFYSEKAARRWLPLFGALFALDGVIGI